MGICFAMTPVQYKVSRFILVCFSTYLKTKHLLQQKRAVEAAQTNRLRSRRVKIHLRKIRSQRCRLQN